MQDCSELRKKDTIFIHNLSNNYNKTSNKNVEQAVYINTRLYPAEKNIFIVNISLHYFSNSFTYKKMD